MPVWLSEVVQLRSVREERVVVMLMQGQPSLPLDIVMVNTLVFVL